MATAGENFGDGKKDDTAAPSRRSRTMTEKGRAFIHTETEKKYSRAVNNAKKAAGVLEDHLNYHDTATSFQVEGESIVPDIVEIISAKKTVIDSFETALELRGFLLDLCADEEECHVVDQKIASLDVRVKTLLDRARTIIADTKGPSAVDVQRSASEHHDLVNNDDHKSAKSKTGKSSKHKASHRESSRHESSTKKSSTCGSSTSHHSSHQTSTSSLKIKLAEAEARSKILRLEEEFLDQFLKLEVKTKQLQARQEARKSEVELEVLKKYVDGERYDKDHGKVSVKGEKSKHVETTGEMGNGVTNEDQPSNVGSSVSSISPPPSRFKVEIRDQESIGLPRRTEPRLTPQREHPTSSNDSIADPSIVNSVPSSVTKSKSEGDERVHTLSNLSSKDDVILELLRQQAAPEITMEKFDGDPLMYRQFITSFAQNVETLVPDQIGRLKRLIQYTEGTPHAMISSLIYDTKSGYTKALEILESEFGSLYAVTAAYDKQVDSWKRVLPDDGKGFLDYYVFLLKIKHSLDSTEFRVELDTQENLRKLARKLPNYIQDRWNRKDTNIKFEKKRKTNFDDFINFVKIESNVKNNPSFGRDIMRGENDGRFGNKKYKSALTKNEDSKCGFCKSNHGLDDCRNFERLSLSDRQAFVREDKRCYRCLLPMSFQHSAKSCKKPLSCRVCKRSHPTMLHNDARCQPRNPNKPKPESLEKKEESSTEPKSSDQKPEASYFSR